VRIRCLQAPPPAIAPPPQQGRGDGPVLSVPISLPAGAREMSVIEVTAPLSKPFVATLVCDGVTLELKGSIRPSPDGCYQARLDYAERAPGSIRAFSGTHLLKRGDEHLVGCCSGSDAWTYFTYTLEPAAPTARAAVAAGVGVE
jgi:hypothetical protein